MPRLSPRVTASPSTTRGRARRTASRHVGMGLILSAVLVLGGVVLYVSPQVRLVSLGYQHSKLLQQRAQHLQRQKELQVELGSLRQLRRIEEIAAQHLGLRHPQATQVLYVRPGAQGAGPRRE